MTTLAEALAPKSDQLNADDLIAGPRTITITDARITKSERQTRITLNFSGDNGRPFNPCKTMGRAMVIVWGIVDEKEMIGKSITVYRDPEVKFGDQGQVGGIRISHMSHIDKPTTVKLTVSQGKKGLFTFQPLIADVRQIKPDKVAEGVKALLARIADGEDIDADAAVTKQRKWLETNRPELFAEIEAALKARAPAADNPFGIADEGPSDSQRGESHTSTPDEWLPRIEAADSIDELGTLMAAAQSEHGVREDFNAAQVKRKARGFK